MGHRVGGNVVVIVVVHFRRWKMKKKPRRRGARAHAKNIASRRAHISLYRVNAFGAPPHATDAVRVFRKGKKTGVLFV